VCARNICNSKVAARLGTRFGDLLPYVIIYLKIRGKEFDGSFLASSEPIPEPLAYAK
jgi:hypothetical protein